MRALLLAGWMLTVPLGAGDLESARAAFARFEARTPVAGRLSEIYSRPADGRPGSEPRAELSIQLNAGPAGLELTWDGGLLRKADDEERARDRHAGGGMPLREAMKELDPGRVSHLLDQRASLLGMLGQGTLLKAEDGVYDGRPARKLELSVPVRVGDDRLRAGVSSSEGRLLIWIGADGAPLGSELRLSYAGRMGRIFGRFSVESTIRTRYGVAGDRIFVAHRDSAEVSSDDAGRQSTFVTLDFQPR